jgi:hypothetical protein
VSVVRNANICGYFQKPYSYGAFRVPKGEYDGAKPFVFIVADKEVTRLLFMAAVLLPMTV